MNPCPSQQQLERLQANALSSPEAEVLERHVAACALCQRTLAALAGKSGFQREKETAGAAKGSTCPSAVHVGATPADRASDPLSQREQPSATEAALVYAVQPSVVVGPEASAVSRPATTGPVKFAAVAVAPKVVERPTE